MAGNAAARAARRADKGDLTANEAGDGGELTATDHALLRGFELALRGGWRPRLIAEESVKTYLYAVRRCLRFLRARGMPEAAAATREHLLEYMAELRATARPATADVYLKGARLFFAWLVDEGERRDNPTDRIHPPPPDKRLREAYTVDQVKAIMKSQNPKTLTGARNLAMFAVLLDTGLRRAELVSLTIDAIDWKHGTMKVLGKGSKERKVRMGPAALRAVDSYLRMRARAGIDSAWLWCGPKGLPLSAASVATLHARLTTQLGFHCHPHKWRHAFAQWSLESGMDREYVRELMGHETDVMLRRYTRATDIDRALEAHTRHSPMDMLSRGRKR